MGYLVDYVVNLGLDVGKDKIDSRREEREIRESLRSFIERQRKIEELSSIAEEIDFQGLADYMQGDLVEDIKLCLFGKLGQRRAARKIIITKAVEYSYAKNDISRKKVTKLISDILEILKHYYRSKVGREYLLLAAEVVDEISIDVEEQLDQREHNITRAIDNASNKVGEQIINVLVDNPYTLDANLQLLQQGNIEKVESNLNTMFNCMSNVHTLNPYYRFGYKMEDGILHLVSQPTSDESIIKYPPSVVFKGSIQLGKGYVKDINNDVIDYAHRHQLPIIINVEEAKKLLGEEFDPAQYEAKRLEGKQIVIPPKPFPNALPYSFLINGIVEFDYLLLRTQEILDDGTIILSNIEQENIPFRVFIKFHLSESKTDFNIRTENAGNKDILKYDIFMKHASEGAYFEVKSLSAGEDLVAGYLNHSEYSGGFETLDKEIDFLKNVVLIEDYFNKNITIPESLYEDDVDIIEYMTTIISGQEYHGNWSETTFSITLNDEQKERISSMEDINLILSVAVTIEIHLFDEIYQFDIRRTFENVRYKNISKLKAKAAVLEAGDTLKLECIPGEANGKGSFVDKICPK